jgi:hypothetical protein
MSDFLTHVVARGLGTGDVIRPRVPSLYEPYGRAGGVLTPRLDFTSRETREASQCDRGLEPEAMTLPNEPVIAHSELRAPSAATRQREGNQPHDPADATEFTPVRQATAKPNRRRGMTETSRQSESLESGALNPRLHSAPRQEKDAVAQVSPAASAVRPPKWPSVKPPNNPLTLPSQSAAEPPIQVTIGRIEVRAVFPDPPTRRVSTSQAKPSVSLDDYLNRRHRGQR